MVHPLFVELKQDFCEPREDFCEPGGGGERKPVMGVITFDLGLRHFYLETAVAG
jgi:hypothetical protein